MAHIQYNIHANPETIPVIHTNWYPPIAAEGKNTDYARLLMPDLASKASEMTTVHQYLFQSWMIEGSPVIRRVIERMVRVEQHHFTIIGQLIALLGGMPECRSKEFDSYWNGNMVNYSCSMQELLSTNAESELYAMQTYASQAEEIKDSKISRMLTRLSLDEKLHHQIFRDFLAQI